MDTEPKSLRIRFQIASDLERHAEARSRLTRFLRATGKPLSEQTIHEIQLALDEALSNITRHSYHHKKGKIDLEFGATKEGIELILRDKGRGFQREQVGKTLPSPEMEGGRGLYILEGVMGDVRYERGSNGENILRLRRSDSHQGWIPDSIDGDELC